MVPLPVVAEGILRATGHAADIKQGAVGVANTNFDTGEFGLAHRFLLIA